MTFYIAIIDYGMGNLKSVSNLLEFLNVKHKITSFSKEILDADGIILPGVGAFGDAMVNLRKKNLIFILDEIVNIEKPLFGICLGMQLLFTKSYEMGEFNGLSYINGEVVSFEKFNVEKIPQIGWNSVNIKHPDHFLVQGIPNNTYFYFVHSYYCIPKNQEAILGLTEYGETKFTSIVYKNNIVATQFHPEKSSKFGQKMFQNFISFCKK